MMRGTLITAEGESVFMETVDAEVRKECDFFIGVYDENTDTACGVMAVEAVGGHTLAIRYIYVDEKWRRRGAGTELIDMLRDIAPHIEAEAIVCSFTRGNISDGIAELLASCGFAETPEMSSSIYRIDLSDLEIKKSKKVSELVRIKSIGAEEWKSFPEEWKNAGGDEAGYEALAEEKDRYDAERSYLALNEKGSPVGFGLVVCHNGENMLEIADALEEHKPYVLNSFLQHMSDKTKMGKMKDSSLIVCPSKGYEEELVEEITGGAKVQVGACVYYSLELAV